MTRTFSLLMALLLAGCASQPVQLSSTTPPPKADAPGEQWVADCSNPHYPCVLTRRPVSYADEQLKIHMAYIGPGHYAMAFVLPRSLVQRTGRSKNAVALTLVGERDETVFLSIKKCAAHACGALWDPSPMLWQNLMRAQGLQIDLQGDGRFYLSAEEFKLAAQRLESDPQFHRKRT